MTWEDHEGCHPVDGVEGYTLDDSFVVSAAIAAANTTWLGNLTEVATKPSKILDVSLERAARARIPCAKNI